MPVIRLEYQLAIWRNIGGDSVIAWVEFHSQEKQNQSWALSDAPATGRHTIHERRSEKMYGPIIQWHSSVLYSGRSETPPQNICVFAAHVTHAF